jgi:glycosyltransferase involved in cell wall biosynthesis
VIKNINNNKLPLITIGIPVRNGKDSVETAIKSVLAQSYTNIEIILSDNFSDDGTSLIVDNLAAVNPRIKVQRRTSLVSASKNFRDLVSSANGEYFFWLAHDDSIEPNFIAEAYVKMQGDSTIVGCCCNVMFRDVEGCIMDDWTKSFENIRAVSDCFAERVIRIFERVGWFAIYSLWRTDAVKKSKVIELDQYYHGFDVLFIAEMLQLGKLERVDGFLFYYTVDRSKDYCKGDPRELISEYKYTTLYIDIIDLVIRNREISWTARLKFFRLALLSITSCEFELRTRIINELSRKIQLNVGSFNFDFVSIMADIFSVDAVCDVSGVVNVPNRRRVLVFVPHCPWPPRTGAHRRFLQIIDALIEFEYDLCIVSTNLFADQKWTRIAIDRLQKKYPGLVLNVYNHSVDDEAWVNSFSLSETFDCDRFSPPGLRHYFLEIQNRFRPQVVLINYVFWSGLIRSGKHSGVKYIVDLHDVCTDNDQKKKVVQMGFMNNKSDPAMNKNELLNYEAELDAVRNFDCAIAISEIDFKFFSDMLMGSSTDIAKIGFHLSDIPVVPKNNYQKDLRFIFVGSDNCFNVQGLRFFISDVIPIIKTVEPGFCLHVYGDCCRGVVEDESVKVYGYVESVEAVFSENVVLVVPLRYATGQQVKVKEALMLGVPVIISDEIGDANRVVDGKNGIRCRSASDFRDACLLLISNRSKVLELSENAVKTAVSDWLIDRCALKSVFDV